MVLQDHNFEQFKDLHKLPNILPLKNRTNANFDALVSKVRVQLQSHSGSLLSATAAMTIGINGRTVYFGISQINRLRPKKIAVRQVCRLQASLS